MYLHYMASSFIATEQYQKHITAAERCNLNTLAACGMITFFMPKCGQLELH